MARKQQVEEAQDDIEEVEETVEEAAEEESSSSDDETTDDEATEDEIAPDIIEEVEDDHTYLLASLGADLEFLYGDNMSFYQANKAYYENRNYEEAVTEFQASIEYEKKSDPSDRPDARALVDSENPPDPEPPNDILCKSIYWMGEAYLKLDQTDQAIEAFGQLSDHYSLHYLAPAAERRIAALQLDTESESV